MQEKHSDVDFVVICVWQNSKQVCVHIFATDVHSVYTWLCALTYYLPFTSMSLHVLRKCMQTLVCMCVCVVTVWCRPIKTRRLMTRGSEQQQRLQQQQTAASCRQQEMRWPCLADGAKQKTPQSLKDKSPPYCCYRPLLPFCYSMLSKYRCMPQDASSCRA